MPYLRHRGDAYYTTYHYTGTAIACGIVEKNCSVNNTYNIGTAQTCAISSNNCINSYFLETSGPSGYCGISKTAQAMKSVSFPIILNGTGDSMFVFDSENFNDGYPILSWQKDQFRSIVVSCNEVKGSTSGTGTYISGSNATISATPNSGYMFTRWNDGDTSNPRTIKVTNNAQYVALFEQAVINVKVGQDCSITQE